MLRIDGSMFIGSNQVLIYSQVSHPPACATKFIISLGILPGRINGLIIIYNLVIPKAGREFRIKPTIMVSMASPSTQR